MNDKWLNDIKDRLDGYETPLPDGLWESINDDLEDPAVSNLGFRPLLRWAAAVALLIVFGGVILILSGTLAEDTELVSDNFTSENVSDMIRVDRMDSGCKIAQDLVSDEITRHVCSRQIIKAEVAAATDDFNSDYKSEDNAAENHLTEEENIAEVTAEEDVVTIDNGSEHQFERISDPGSGIHDYSPAEKTSTGSSVSLNIHSTGFSSLMGSGNGILPSAGKMSDPVNGPVGAFAWSDSYLLGIMALNHGREMKSEIHHRLPVVTGVSVDYLINDRLGLSAGLTYSYLSSDLFDGSDDNYVAGRQKLHYIGVPLRFNFRALSWKRLALYASAGPKIEKCVAATLSNDYVIGRQLMDSEKREVDEKPWQLSVNLSAGAMLSLSREASVYVEPGVSYFFDDGSSLRTVYKDHPWNFELNVGLRFTLNP